MSIWKLTTLGIAILLLTFAGSISPGAVSAQQTSACATGGAVPDAANNPGLVSDCAALLAARDTWRDRHAQLDGGYSHSTVGRRHNRRITPARHAVNLRKQGIDRGDSDGVGQPLQAEGARPL